MKSLAAVLRGRLTPSKANLAAACPPALALPWMRSENAWQGAGLVVHLYLELLQRYRNGELEAVDESGERIPVSDLRRLAKVVRARMPAEHRAALEAIDLDRLPLDPGIYRVGEAFAYNWKRDSGRALEVAEHRGYAGLFDSEEEIPGTTDIRGDTGPNDPRGRAAVVIDYKLWAPDSPPLRDDLQLLLYALAICRAFGYERALLAKVRIRDGNPSWEWEELDALALDAAAARVRAVVERVLELAPEVGGAAEPLEVVRAYNHGTHCRHCPAVWACPAKMRLAGELVAATRPGQPGLLPELNQENQDAAYRRLAAASDLLEKLWEVYDAYARQAAAAGHPVQAGNGYVYAPARRERETFDPLASVLLLAQAFDVEAARRAVQRKPEVLVESLEAAVEDLLERAKKDAGLRARVQEHLGERRLSKKAVLEVARALLRGGGASAVSVTHPVMRHKPREEDASLLDERSELRRLLGEVARTPDSC